MDRSYSVLRLSERGQGLVEYSLILVFVALVVMVVLSLFGPSIGNVFSNIVDDLNVLGGGNTSDGVYDPSVTLTASPGGVMGQAGNHYCLNYSLTGCPCVVSIASSEGGSATVTVGP